MSDLTVAELVSGLQRTTLALAATALVVWCLLRLTRSSSPALHRAAWIAVLLQGWMLIRWVVNVPWYDPPSRVPRPPAFDFSEAASMSPRDVPPPPPVLRPAARERWNWQVFVLAGWMTGMVAAVGYWITVYVRFVRGLPLGDPADAVAEAAWQRLLVERNVRCLIPLRLANGLGPVLCRLPAGYRLLLPRTEWQNLCIDARMTILRHELAHYEHADVWKSLAARLLALPHWFNPFAWWTVRNFDEGAEWACDDAVRTAAPEKASALGRALLQLGAGKTSHGILNPAAQGRGLARRIRRLLTLDIREDSNMKKSLVIVVGLSLLLVGGLRLRLVAHAAAGDQAPFGSAEAKAHAAQAQAMLDWAEKTYEATNASYQVGTEVFANVYVWSRRWLEAERALAETKDDDLSALLGHWNRTYRLHLKIKALYREGIKGGEAEKYRASEYYVAEAELWLVAAGGTVPDKSE